MNVRGTLADAKALLITWTRAKGVLVVSLVMPLLLLVTFGVIFAPDAPERPLVLVEDADGTPESARLLRILEDHASITLAPLAPPGGADEVAWLRAQGAVAYLRIPEGFGTGGDAASVRVLLDPSEPAHASAAQSALEAALARHDGSGPLGTRLHLERAPVAPQAPYSAFLLAGVLGLSAMLVGLSLGYHSISELRHAGLLERLAVSPLSKREWLFARMGATSLVGGLSAALLFGAALLVFPAPPHGTLVTLLLVMGGTLVFSGLGTLLGLAVKDPQTGSAVMNLALLPMVILSGAFFDVARLPTVLQWAAQASPLTHLNNGIRADLLTGDTGTALLHAGALLLASLVILLAGSRLIRWTQDD